MTRKGRPRRTDVERTSCGKIKDRTLREPADDVAAWPRIRELVKAKAIDPRFGTELGRLAYFDKIRPIEADAGKHWANLVLSYRRHINGAPAESPKIASLEAGIGRGVSSQPDKDPDALEKLDDAYEDARESIEEAPPLPKDIIIQIENQYDKAFIALVDRADGVKIMRAVNTLCLEDSPLDYERLLLARRGLMGLARHFGLDKRNKT
jgi:hypothetical protein